MRATDRLLAGSCDTFLAIDLVPNGEYEARDALDDDASAIGPCPIRVRITIRASEPQLTSQVAPAGAGAINAVDEVQSPRSLMSSLSPRWR